MKFGFPLDFDKAYVANLSYSEVNHASANQILFDRSYYLIQSNIYSPFDSKPYGTSTHISPFMSWPKGANERHIIIDLSWRKEASVNTFTQNKSLYQ